MKLFKTFILKQTSVDHNAADKGETSPFQKKESGIIIIAKICPCIVSILSRLFAAFSMDVIASSAFSTKIDSHTDPDNEFISTAKLVFAPKQRWRFFFLCEWDRTTVYSRNKPYLK